MTTTTTITQLIRAAATEADGIGRVTVRTGDGTAHTLADPGEEWLVTGGLTVAGDFYTAGAPDRPLRRGDGGGLRIA